MSVLSFCVCADDEEEDADTGELVKVRIADSPFPFSVPLCCSELAMPFGFFVPASSSPIHSTNMVSLFEQAKNKKKEPVQRDLGFSPLHLAIWADEPAVVQLLVDKGELLRSLVLPSALFEAIRPASLFCE
jgi:hypothetical protein